MRYKSLFVRALEVCFLLAFLAIFAFAQDGKITEGSLRVVDEKGAERGLCPLKTTEVRAEISGFISRVTVTQTFQNPSAEAIEAVYTFPLPNNAAVDAMTINIGTRTVRSKIAEREAAQKIYEQAKQEGKVAALLEQQRPNIFTQYVANITPGAEIKVVISYVETLKYADDFYEFSFPMTVGERYLPSSVDAGEAAKISPKSETRPAHTISLEMNIEAGVAIENLASNTHEIEVLQTSVSRFSIKLKNENEISNRDFVLKYKTAGAKMSDAVLTHKQTGNDGFFTLILQPPDKIFPNDAMPKEIVFVLDTSGSMSGFPIEKAKEAMNLTLDNLNPNDTFNLITFAGDTRILFDKPVPATVENLEQARKFLSDSKSSGGTEMMKAIKAALEPTDSQTHVRIVCFMTDGYVGNEAEIISEVQKHPNARVFGFGIGGSVNRYLLDEISREGRGEVEYIAPTDDGSAAARRFYERVRNPLLTDISLEFQGLTVSEVLPREIPDLFDAKPVAVVGRYSQGGSGKIILRGKMRGQPFEREIAVNFADEAAENDALASLWARRKVADLIRQDFAGFQAGKMKDDLREAITNLGLQFNLLTPFTSFVAVEDQIVTDGSETKRIEVPVAVPINRVVNETNTVTVNAVSNSVIDVSDTKIQTNVIERGLDFVTRGKGLQSAFSITAGTTQANETQTQTRQGLISSNGQFPTSNDFTVDGANANLGVNLGDSTLSENIGALPILTASGGTNNLLALDATQEVSVKTIGGAKEQRTPGARVNFVSSGGNNQFRGSLFETFGNESLNANDFFANSRGLNRPPSRLNQFGGTFSGFFVKDKAWFFGNYEGLRLRQAAFAVSEVPTLASRQNALPNVRPLLDGFPLANGRETSNGFAEFAATFTNPAANDIFGVRIDAQPISKLRFMGRFGYAESKAALRGDRDFSLNTLRRNDTKITSLTFLSNYNPTTSIVFNGFVNFTRNRVGQQFSLDNFGGANVSSSIFAQSFDFLKYDLTRKNSALAIGNRIETELNQFQAGGDFVLFVRPHILTFGTDFRRLSADVGAARNERNVLFAGINPNGTASRINELTRTLPSNFSLSNLSIFAQDKWQINSRLTLDLGLRWDADFAPKTDAPNLFFQDASTQMRGNFKNFAPRFGIIVDLLGDGKAVLRGSFGLYFDYGNSRTDFANSSPFVSGNFVRNTVFNTAPTNSFTPLVAFENNLQTPRTWQVFVEYQQQIFDDYVFTATYTGAFGRKLFLTRTLFDTTPNFNFVRLTNNDGESDFHAAQFRLERRFANGFLFNARYALSKSIDNIPSRNAFVGANSASERGASDFDTRHNFSIYGTFEIPAPFENGWKNLLTKNWTIFAFANTRTAFPLNITYARFRDFGVEYFRPDLISNPNGTAQINAANFAIPSAERQGTLGKNVFRGAAFFQLDAGLEKRFKLSESANLRLKIEVFNLTNRPNFADADGNLGTIFDGGNFQPNTYFGQTTSTFGSNNFTPFYLYGGARSVQLTAKFVF